MYRLRKLRVAALLSSMEMIHGLRMMSGASAENRWLAEIVAGRLAMTEHKAGIEMGTWLRQNTRLE